MSGRFESRQGRRFRGLLRILPREFREEFGGEMEEVFCDQLNDAVRRRGNRGRWRVWGSTILDIFRIAPREHISDMRRDAAYALRMMRRNPGFTLVALLTLALGIGANVSVFSIVNAVFLRPLPFPESDKLFWIQRTDNRIGGASISWPIFLAWRQKQELFSSMGVVLFTGSRTLTGAGEPALVSTLGVTPGVFPALGVQPALGRTFRDDEGGPGDDGVVVISDVLWRSRFSGDPGIIGRTITLNGAAATVIGVMPRGFDLPLPSMRGTQVWLGSRPPASSDNPSNGIWCLGRLRAGVTATGAEAGLTPALVALSGHFPNMIFPEEKTHLVSMREFLIRRAGEAPLLLMGAVGFLLLIACANVANILLARATERRREMAVRAALGAGRFRIIRQLLTESMILATAGAAVGTAACFFSFDLILRLVPVGLPYVGAIRIDAVVLIWTMALSLFTGIVFGLVPALTVSGMDPSGALKEGTSRTGTGRGRSRMRSALIVGEVSLALVLLMGAALLIQSFERLMHVKPGFETDNLLTFRVRLPRAAEGGSAGSQPVLEHLTQRIASMPGVLQTGFIDGLPLDSQGDLLFSIEGRSDPETARGDASIRAASPDYFSAMRIPIERGRAFTSADRDGTLPVALINRALARYFWPEEDPVGAYLWVGKPMGPSWTEPSPRRIVGIVGDVRDQSLALPPGFIIYEPATQAGELGGVSFVVRSSQSPQGLIPLIRNVLKAEMPGQPVDTIRPMDQVVSQAATTERFYAILLGLFGCLGLLIVTIGVYGVISYMVVQHTHEIGVRMAFGATKGCILRWVLSRSLALAGVGIVIGATSSFVLTGLLRGMLFDVQPNDPWTLAGVAFLLLSVALLASWVPAQRALRLDPMTALRSE